MACRRRSEEENRRNGWSKMDTGRARCPLQIARLAFFAPALLGRAVSDRLARMANTKRCRKRTAARAAGAGGFQTDRHRRTATGESEGMDSLFGRQRTRETNTMPQWAGSCWYYLRFMRSAERRPFCRRRSGTLLDGRRATRRRRSLRRRDRARGAASACMRGSGTRCCSISAIFQNRSRSSAW